MDLAGQNAAVRATYHTVYRRFRPPPATDHVDLYHRIQDDPQTPLEETLGAYDRLIRQGKLRFIGASNYSGERLRAALETSRRNSLPMSRPFSRSTI